MPRVRSGATELRDIGAPEPANRHRASAEPGTADPLKPMMPLGQFRDTFIIAVDADGIAIIDQHVAHERVLFERVMEKLSSGRLESQRLLEPMLVELSPEGRQALLSHAADLDRLGFGVDDFGGETLRVTARARGAGRRGLRSRPLRALAEDLEGLDRGRDVGDALRRIAATTACHAAVKANYPLTHEKMLHILEELRRTAYSTVCPHGRPGDAAPDPARDRKELSTHMSPRRRRCSLVGGPFSAGLCDVDSAARYLHGRPDGARAESVLRRRRHVHRRLAHGAAGSRK